jgi:hypothetical protein
MHKTTLQIACVSADFRGIIALLAAETLAFFHVNTHKPALTLLREGINLC